jgi:RNA polymerase sigma-70 factor, ECF subfamily
LLALRRASALGSVGRYQFEAAAQSARVVRCRTGRADCAASEKLYDALLAFTRSPVMAINRAVAIAETRGPATSLEALDALLCVARLAEYQPYRAALLARSGSRDAGNTRGTLLSSPVMTFFHKNVGPR